MASFSCREGPDESGQEPTSAEFEIFTGISRRTSRDAFASFMIHFVPANCASSLVVLDKFQNNQAFNLDHSRGGVLDGLSERFVGRGIRIESAELACRGRSSVPRGLAGIPVIATR